MREGVGQYAHVYAATGRPTVSVPLGGARQMDEAVQAARRALPAWRALRADHRRDLLLRLSQLLLKHAERLSTVQTIESGVPRQFAAMFPARGADHFSYFAGWADKVGGEVLPVWPGGALDYTICEPYGVVAVIIPWNGPLMSIGQVLAPALAAGNTVVLKPPELAPFTSLLVGELMLEAGFPPGVVNVVPGGPEAGDALVRHPGINKIHFTGSGATARKIIAASQENLTPHCFELGGKSAFLIFADADPMVAAQQALSGAVVLSGQGCANATRVLVEASVYDRLLRLTAGLMRRIPVGDPLAAETVMGPVVSAAACTRILEVIERAKARGQGRLVSGGERLGGELAEGYFIAPTLFADVEPDSELAQEEIFGPVVSFMRFETEQQAIEIANATRYGLAGYVHTSDLKRAHRVCAALEAGAVWVNGLDAMSPSVPFGGMKQSGYGRIGGSAAIREFTRLKNVWVSM